MCAQVVKDFMKLQIVSIKRLISRHCLTSCIEFLPPHQVAECRHPEKNWIPPALRIYRRRFVQCQLGCLHREKCFVMNIKIPVQAFKPKSYRCSRLETNKQPLPDVNCCNSLQDLNTAIMILKRVEIVERINGIAKWGRRHDYRNAHDDDDDVNQYED